MNFAGLDLGTTGVKAIVINETGTVLATSYRSYPLITPYEGWCELNPDDIWNACKYVLSDISKQTSRNFSSLALSSHAQAVVPVDCNGKTLYNFISTVDTRTRDELEFWKQNYNEYKIYQKTGLPYSAIYTANKLLWLKKHREKVFFSAEKFLCVQDFINWKLTGETVIDYSLASRGMLFNQETKKWDDTILSIIGIDNNQLSVPASSGTIIGHPLKQVEFGLGLPSNLKVVCGGHDQTCSCIGSGVLHPGQIMNSTGTVEVLEAISPHFIADSKILEFHYPCTPYIAKDSYLVMSINNSGGLLLQWYLKNLCQAEVEAAKVKNIDPYDYVISCASDSISNVFVLPHLNGAETPFQDSDSACCFVHMRVDTTKGDITRGLLESMAYELRLNLESFKEIGCSCKEIHATGGGAKNSRFLQIKANVTQTPIICSSAKECAAVGAAIIGAVGMNHFESYDEAVASIVKQEKVFYPDIALQPEYTERFEEYKCLYPTLQRFNRKVSERIKRDIPN